MEKYQILKEFIDAETGQRYEVGQEVDFSKARSEAVLSVDKFIKPVAKHKATPAPDKAEAPKVESVDLKK